MVYGFFCRGWWSKLLGTCCDFEIGLNSWLTMQLQKKIRCYTVLEKLVHRHIRYSRVIPTVTFGNLLVHRVHIEPLENFGTLVHIGYIESSNLLGTWYIGYIQAFERIKKWHSVVHRVTEQSPMTRREGGGGNEGKPSLF